MSRTQPKTAAKAPPKTTPADRLRKIIDPPAKLQTGRDEHGFEVAEQPASGGESRHDRWLRIMNERLSEFQQFVRENFYSPLIDRKGNYEYSYEEAQKVVSVLRAEIDALQQTLQDPKKSFHFVDLRLLQNAVSEARVIELIREHLPSILANSLAPGRKDD